VVNLSIHLLNCLLVFYFIFRLNSHLPVAFITALLFGIHPLHVESVAWISERKDVLYAFFYILSLVCYLFYLDNKSTTKYYFFTLFFFILSLLSKPMAVTLPFVLFLMDYLRNQRIKTRSLFEKIPFFIFSFLFGIVTLYAQRLSEHSDPTYAFPVSIFVACHGLLFYLYKMFLPIKLAALYRYPLDNTIYTHFEYVIAPIIVLFISSLIYYSSKFTKNIVWGSLFYLITLLPVIQLLPIGLAVASDRYTYVPLIGIFFILSNFFVWIWNTICKNHVYLRLTAVLFSILIVFQLSTLTYRLCKVWKDDISLWSNVIRYYPKTDLPYNNRGGAYFKISEYDNALSDFFKAIEINPQYAEAHSNICSTYFKKNEIHKALPYCESALRIKPLQPNTYAILGDIYWTTDKALSIELYKKAISMSSHYFAGHARLCKAYMELHKYDDAYPICLQAVTYNPDDVAFCNNTGNFFLSAGQYGRALAFYRAALSVSKALPEVHSNLSVLYYYLNDYASAIKHFNIAAMLGHNADPEFKKLIEQQQKKTGSPKND